MGCPTSLRSLKAPLLNSWAFSLLPNRVWAPSPQVLVTLDPGTEPWHHDSEAETLSWSHPGVCVCVCFRSFRGLIYCLGSGCLATAFYEEEESKFSIPVRALRRWDGSNRV